MRIYPSSDLHFRSKLDVKDWALEEVPKDCDVVAIAGDIANGSKIGVKYIQEVCDLLPNKKIVLCLGNHDYWGDVCITSVYARWKDLARRVTNLVFLNGNSAKIGNVRFIGTTLWTDMGLTDNVSAVKNVYHVQWPDYANINVEAHIFGFPADEFINQFKVQLNWIYAHLEYAKERGEQVYVMTHHLPDPKSLDERYAGSDFNPFYASKNILEFTACQGVWHHGHTHTFKDYIEKDWRVICNPRGYLFERCNSEMSQRLADNKLIITLGD